MRAIPVEFDCAVLEDDTRVISERAFSRAIGAKRGGSHWQRLKADLTGANLPLFLSANNLRPFIDKDVAKALSSPVIYRTENGGIGYGIRAELIPQILDVWLKARDANKLTAKQSRFADLADLLMRDLAATSIIALVDEATGYQYLRARDALVTILDAFVDKSIRKWIRRFPIEWFRQICRLRGVEFREDMKLPQYFGHMINDLVYDRLAPGVRAKLNGINPRRENGRCRDKHTQWLTPKIGVPELILLLGRQEGMAYGFADGDWEGFYAAINKMMPKYGESPLLDQIPTPGLPAS